MGKVLPSGRNQIIEQAKFTYSPFRKAFEKQVKTTEDQEKKKKEIKKVENNQFNQLNLMSHVKKMIAKKMLYYF